MKNIEMNIRELKDSMDNLECMFSEAKDPQTRKEIRAVMDIFTVELYDTIEEIND